MILVELPLNVRTEIRNQLGFEQAMINKVTRYALMSLCIVCGGTLRAEPDIIGHRGASFHAPENTLPSLKKAWRDGADGAELDIHLTADGKAVLIHDKTTSRTVPGTNFAIAKTNYDELRKLDAGSWKDRKYAGTYMPLLEEALDAQPRKQKLFIEVKSDSKILPLVKQLVDASGKKDKITIIGFEFETMKAAKKLMPELPVYWLLGTKKDPITKKPLKHKLTWIKEAKEAGLDGVNVNWEGLDARFARAVHASGLDLGVWTVNEIPEMRRLVRLGVDAITTDKPLELKTVMLQDLQKSTSRAKAKGAGTAKSAHRRRSQIPEAATAQSMAAGDVVYCVPQPICICD